MHRSWRRWTLGEGRFYGPFRENCAATRLLRIARPMSDTLPDQCLLRFANALNSDPCAIHQFRIRAVKLSQTANDVASAQGKRHDNILQRQFPLMIRGLLGRLVLVILVGDAHYCETFQQIGQPFGIKD